MAQNPPAYLNATPARDGSTVPLLNFDIASPLAAIHLICLMCEPDPAKRDLMHARFATHLMADEQQHFPPLIERLIELSDLPDPARAAFDSIMRSYSNPNMSGQALQDALFELANTWKTGRIQSFRNLIDGFDELWNLARAEAEDEFHDLMEFLRHPDIRHVLRTSPDQAFRYTSAKLFHPAGGLTASTNAPSLRQMYAEIEKCCKGHAMQAAKFITLVARLEHNPSPAYDSSKGHAYTILEYTHVASKTTLVSKALKRWLHIGPLWAGVFVASDYQTLDYKGLSAFCADPSNRVTAISYARWFANFSSKPRGNGALEPLIPTEQVIQFDTTIEAQKPPLPPLNPQEHKAAVSHKPETAAVRKAERSSRK